VTINDEATNKNVSLLGDRDLALWVGDGIYAFATYTYNDMNGRGNPNVYKSVKYGEQLPEWHFVYFAYTRKQRKAYGYVAFKGRKEVVQFDGINHYLAKQYRVFVAKDRFYPSFSGKVARFRMKLCGGAYDPNFPEDPETPVTPSPPTPTPPTPTPTKTTSPPPTTPPSPKTPTVKPEPKCIEGADEIVDAAFNRGAVANTRITGEDLKDVSEYGYGFWMRFLTRYPVALMAGKRAPWYFVSRLTTNNPYGNIEFGDRTLAVW
jgi:hypothetical protein